MAKSSRSSTKKANNQRLKQNVFGPVETARAERLSAKLLELAKQPVSETEPGKMHVEEEEEDGDATKTGEVAETVMEIDDSKPSSSRSDRNRVSKRKSSKSYKNSTTRLYGNRTTKKRAVKK